MLKQFMRVWQRTIWSWDGVTHVWKTEGSMRQWVFLNIVLAVLAFALPLTAGDRGMVLMGGIIVMAAECMNTAIERVVDDIGPELRDAAKHAKDCGSAAVAMTAVAVGVAWAGVLIGLL